MKKIKSLFIMGFLVWAAMFIMTACGGGTDENGEPTPSAPGTPTINDIFADNRQLVVLWGAVNNANTYNLYWNTTGGVTTSDTSLTGLLTTYYVHSELSLFKTYSYRVSAVNAGGASGLSSEVSALAAGIPEELWKRTAVDAADGDELGASIAISGDYIVVGAPDKAGGGFERGAAYVFYRNYGGPDNWGQAKKLTASIPDDYDWFGCSVAISGDYVVVGADGDDDGGSQAGAAYIYARNQGGTDNWGQVAKLTASDAAAGDYFGNSVAISGDYVVVGARYEMGAGSNYGAAYVFDRNFGGPDNWGEVQKLSASDAQNGDQFGISVAISGDTAVVGAHMEDGAGGTNRGAAYIFNRDEGGTDNWGEVAIIAASDADDYDWFGYSVAISGDTAVVGAVFDDGSATNSGAAYIFNRDEGGADNWGQVVKLVASDAEVNENFGISVGIYGDYVVVGADQEDGGGTVRGAAYVYDRNLGGMDNWGEAIKLVASDAEDSDYFGMSVAIYGDYAVVGANREDGGGTDRGAIYIF